MPRDLPVGNGQMLVNFDRHYRIRDLYYPHIGEENHGGLSFPEPGVTLALDFPNHGEPLFEMLDRLDELVVEAGGKVYLGKDARLSKENFRRMYPEWSDWKAVRDAWDPEGIFQSDLGRRLGLVDEE